jgi:hypothetical protein
MMYGTRLPNIHLNKAIAGGRPGFDSPCPNERMSHLFEALFNFNFSTARCDLEKKKDVHVLVLDFFVGLF